MKKNISSIITLTLIGIISAFFISYTYKKTYPQVILNEKNTENKARKIVFPVSGEVTFEEKTITINKTNITYLNIVKNTKTIGYIVKTVTTGYSPNLTLMAGISTNGIIQGIQILKDEETPGLGKKASEDNWMNQFIGLTYNNLPLNKSDFNNTKNGDKNLHAISGATFTSVGVTAGIRKIAENIFSSFTNN